MSSNNSWCESEWDSSSMKWRKDRTPSFHEDSFPSPLYVFGYGSLIWKPAILEKYLSFRATALGYRRVFAQRSCDHRGTCDFPGLVLNLVSNEHFTSSKGHESIETDCHGLVWLIPPEKVLEILEYLDDRESGGYDRQLVTVELTETTPHHHVGAVVQALAYIGHPTNPNFYLPSAAYDSSGFVHDDQDHSITADIIAVAKGSSGSNVEYLLRLQRYLSACGMADHYINDLSRTVRQRIGVWRRKEFQSDLAVPSSWHSMPILLAGWGCNENSQLSCKNISNGDIKNIATEISSRIPPCSRSKESTLAHIIPVVLREEIEHFHVIAGGSSSALVRGSSVTIWGKLAMNLSKRNDSLYKDENSFSIVIEGIVGAAMGYNHLLLLLQNDMVVGLGDNLYSQCDPPTTVGFPAQKVTLVNLSEEMYVYKVEYEGPTIIPQYKTAKLAAGLKHSAAITTCGGLLTWGEDKNGQSFSIPSIWYPDQNAKLVDVSCGAEQTFVVDDLGRIFSMGSNLYGSLGRCKEGLLIDRNMCEISFPGTIKFQKISSGWSHSIARGVQPNGELAFYCWGRNDKSQYIVQPDMTGMKEEDFGVKQLAQLPNANARILEVWCGHEFTIVMDDQGGHLWRVGLNTCRSLGVDDNKSKVVNQWERVPLKVSGSSLERSDGDAMPMVQDSYLMVHLWEGSVACGGEHVICIVK